MRIYLCVCERRRVENESGTFCSVQIDVKSGVRIPAGSYLGTHSGVHATLYLYDHSRVALSLVQGNLCTGIRSLYGRGSLERHD